MAPPNKRTVTMTTTRNDEDSPRKDINSIQSKIDSVIMTVVPITAMSLVVMKTVVDSSLTSKIIDIDSIAFWSGLNVAWTGFSSAVVANFFPHFSLAYYSIYATLNFIQPEGFVNKFFKMTNAVYKSLMK